MFSVVLGRVPLTGGDSGFRHLQGESEMKMRAYKLAIAAALTGSMCGCINFNRIVGSLIDHAVWDLFVAPVLAPVVGG